jgi:hypothetical protein
VRDAAVVHVAHGLWQGQVYPLRAPWHCRSSTGFNAF